MKYILFLLLFPTIVYSSEKIALIDTGVNLHEINTKKLYFSEFLKCPYNYNTEEEKPCVKIDSSKEPHGTNVFKIISKNVPDHSVLSFIYASPEKSLKELATRQLPNSLKTVYEKKQTLIKISELIAESINLAIINKATVINISLGDRGLYSKKLEETIFSNKNVLFVFSAGNNNDNLDIDYKKSYPCSMKFENTICVGSKTNNKLTYYTNYGNDVDLYIEPVIDEGTSFSAPIIANEAFLLKLNSKKSIKEIKDFLIKKYN